MELCSDRDGVPYCEADYHTQFGIRCDSCSRYISGRVLEVGPCLSFSFISYLLLLLSSHNVN